jgi:hypothetical protein
LSKESVRHNNMRLSYDFPKDSTYAETSHHQTHHQNPISSKEKKLIAEIVNNGSNAPNSGGSSNTNSKNTLKSYLNQAPKNIFNISKVDTVPKIKKMPSKTESNSKSKSRDSNLTISRVNSVSQSKSQSKTKNNVAGTQVVTATLNTIVKKDSVKDFGKTAAFMKLNKQSSKPLITCVNDLTNSKANQSQQSLLNDYSNKASKMSKRSLKTTDLQKGNYSTSNIYITSQFKKSGLSPQNQGRSVIEKKKIVNPSTPSNKPTNLTMGETKKNLPRKIMDLTYNTNSSNNQPQKIIRESHIDLNELEGITVAGENKEGLNENIIKEVKLNLDENYQNFFNFSYYNFLNKDHSESMHSKSKSMHSKNTFLQDNENIQKIDESLYKKGDIHPDDLSSEINDEI